MREIKDWNGHHVLAIPSFSAAEQDPVSKAYAEAVGGLIADLGATPELRLCWLCPMHQADAEMGFYQCAHPQGLSWTLSQRVDQGGCRRRVIVAEEYIPLVKMRLGERT